MESKELTQERLRNIPAVEIFLIRGEFYIMIYLILEFFFSHFKFQMQTDNVQNTALLGKVKELDAKVTHVKNRVIVRWPLETFYFLPYHKPKRNTLLVQMQRLGNVQR